ncbi:MAG: tRNA uridine-5-carboxymethylaminomethyl(34) synthesis GTPase MnmE [Hyphomicrobiales bacterium]|nr:MAG: tRNA uridine-5-carboxymethylaminomethyl(34) synthesis GTPase MnmE [Hyphomicrobiales bacterium]
MSGLDTIFALSSGQLPSGIAVIRISGSRCRFVIETMAGKLPSPRKASLCEIVSFEDKQVLDQGLVLWFPGPKSFTGEDCAELQIHGGRAVVAAVLRSLGSIDGLRMADAGEFSRRAFENGRLDLTELEGLSDLIAAQSEAQRKQAYFQSRGELRQLLEDWRHRLIHMRALVEADFDFSDEEDVPGSVADGVWDKAQELRDEIATHLNDGRIGEIVRDGFRIVLMGLPNSGKSSLLNALSKRDVAIVTEIAGTTRDLIEVELDIAGYLVVVCDTAGIRDSGDFIEQEGVRRAKEAGDQADMIIWLWEAGAEDGAPETNLGNQIVIRSKDDDGSLKTDLMTISTKSGYGMESLISLIARQLETLVSNADQRLVTRERHRSALVDSVTELTIAIEDKTGPNDLRVEYLRKASDDVGRIVGRVDVEDLLDVIFAEFCVGK